MARTKGATSFITVSLRQLTQVLSLDAQVPISRRFANELGITGSASYATRENLKAAGNPPALEEKIPVHEVE